MGIGITESIDPPQSTFGDTSDFRYALFVGLVVFSAAMVGIATRLDASLASIWPANALLLGLFVRWPRIATWQSWVAASCAYVLADVLTGTDGSIAIWLSITNLTGVAVGVLLFGLVDPAHRRLLRPGSMLLLAAISAACAMSTAFAGATLAPDRQGESWVSNYYYWLAAEFSYCILILPLILVASRPARIQSLAPNVFFKPPTWTSAMPALALIGSVIASALIGGSGALAVASPALIWCALAYGLPGTALATMAFGLMTMFGKAAGWLDIGTIDHTNSGIVSIRIGVSLLALGPLTVASIDRSRKVAMLGLETMANSDSLTGLNNRRSFEKLGRDALRESRHRRGPVSMAMVDLDDFKHINDTYGHQAGDKMLVDVATILNASLPSRSVLARLGGDEFVALMVDVSPEEARRILESVKTQIMNISTAVVASGSTISFGISHFGGNGEASLESLISAADAALYAAKARNDVSVYPRERRNLRLPGNSQGSHNL